MYLLYSAVNERTNECVTGICCWFNLRFISRWCKAMLRILSAQNVPDISKDTAWKLYTFLSSSCFFILLIYAKYVRYYFVHQTCISKFPAYNIGQFQYFASSVCFAFSVCLHPVWLSCSLSAGLVWQLLYTNLIHLILTWCW